MLPTVHTTGEEQVPAAGWSATTTPSSEGASRDVRLFTRVGAAFTDAEWDRFCGDYEQIFTIFPSNGPLALEDQRIKAIKARNPGALLLSYASALNTANLPIGRREILEQHPDWFLRDAQGEMIYDREFPLSFVTDPGNEEWRAFLAAACATKVSTLGYDGIWLDLVQPVYYPMCNAPAINPRSGGNYTDDEWREDQRVLAGQVKRAIGGDKVLLMNGAQAGTRYLHRNYPLLLDEADGVCFEGFVHGTGMAIDEFRPPEAWHDDLFALIDAEQRGKLVQCFTKHKPEAGSAEQIERVVLYSFATFLLGKGPNCTFSVYCKTPGVGQIAPNCPIPALWRTPLGTPLGPHKERNGVYVRYFVHALAAVNPTPNEQLLDLRGRWYTPLGQVVSTWRFSGNTGVVLFRSLEAMPQENSA